MGSGPVPRHAPSAERVAVFLKSNSANQEIIKVLKDLHQFKNPASNFEQKRFEDDPTRSTEFLEAVCRKHRATMFGYGSSTKRRPNHLILGRLYNSKILDLFQFHARDLVGNHTKRKTIDASLGTSPCFVFLGEAWTKDNALSQFKNYMLDCFGVRMERKVAMLALERVVVCMAYNNTEIEIRHFINQMQAPAPGKERPGAWVEDTGRRVGLQLRGRQAADPEILREALGLQALGFKPTAEERQRAQRRRDAHLQSVAKRRLKLREEGRVGMAREGVLQPTDRELDEYVKARMTGRQRPLGLPRPPPASLPPAPPPPQIQW